MQLQEHGVYFDRTLFSLFFGREDRSPIPLELPSEHIPCLLAWDTCAESPTRIRSLLEWLIGLGVSNFDCWGDGCEALDVAIHSVADQQSPPPGIGVATAYFHPDPSLDAALWCFLRTGDNQVLHRSSVSSLAIAVDDTTWSDQIADALRDPKELEERVGSRGLLSPDCRRGPVG